MSLHLRSFQRPAGIRLAVAVVLATLAAACGGSSDTGTGPGTTSGSYVLLASTPTVSIAQGANSIVTISVTPIGTFTGVVSLAVSGLPAGVTATFAASTILAGQTLTSLTLATAASSPVGTTTVTVTGTAPGLSNQTVTFALTITAPAAAGPFTMALTATSFLVLPPTQLSAYPLLTVTRNTGFTGAVALTTTGLPLTLEVIFSPASLTGTTASVTILDIGTAPGTYTATIHGVAASGAGAQTATLQIVVAPATTGSIHWKFCSGSEPQYFFAVKDGSGPWTRIMPSVDSIYSFNIASATGSVARVDLDSGGFRTTVYEYTAAELAARAASQCALVQSVTNRTVNGSFGGVVNLAQVGMGWWIGSAAGNGAFNLQNLPPGPLDVVAFRDGQIASNLEIPVDRAIIRRAQNPASGGTLPVLDFGAAEAIAMTSNTWTFTNVASSETVGVGQLFVTAGATTAQLSPYAGGLARVDTVRTIYGIPLAQTVSGDLHEVIATINVFGTPVGAPNRSSRQIIAYSRSISDRTLAFGPVMPAPTVTSVSGVTAGRLRAVGTLPNEYNSGVAFDVTQSTANHFATVYATRGFLGAGNAYDIQIPDLSAAIGWDTQFALRVGAATNWFLSGGGPVLDLSDDRFLFNSTRSRWTGAQTGVTAPADGAVYLMGRAIGNTIP